MSRPSSKLRSQLLLGLIIFLWAVEILDHYGLGQSLDRYGIQPRQLIGLRGIVLAPFLHGGFAHVLANALPLAGLGWLVLKTGPWVSVSVYSGLSAGLGTWLLAPAGSNHIGASGLVTGYLGFLLRRSLSDRDWGKTGLWLLLLLLLGLEGQNALSWHSHLFGFMGGVLAAGDDRSDPTPRPD
ncbi:MAG: rhomboid family intramembrane serine protease [Cyanobacteria bacterium J06632_22]